MACKFVDDVVYAAVRLNKFEHSAGHHRNYYQLPHAGNAFSHGIEPSVNVERTAYHAYHSAENDAYGEHGHDVHAEYGNGENNDVWHDFDIIYIGNVAWRTDIVTDNKI